jgi:glutathione peroxidase
MNIQIDQIEFKTAAGETARLKDYHGQVVLLVNVASKCGLTPQYTGLEALYEKYRDQGFVVLGFPANEFGAQEPGSNEEIQSFCQMNFGVQFPVFAKIVVKGDAIHPLYRALIEAQPGLTEGSSDKPKDISWNFEKFLLNRQGDVVARFAPAVTPQDPALVKAIEAELALNA